MRILIICLLFFTCEPNDIPQKEIKVDCNTFKEFFSSSDFLNKKDFQKKFDEVPLLVITCTCGLEEILEKAIELNVELNSIQFNSQSLLFFAVKSNNQRVVEILLNYGLDVNKKDNENESAIFQISKMKSDTNAIAGLLLSYNAEFNVTNNFFRLTPIELSILNNNKEVFSILFDKYVEFYPEFLSKKSLIKDAFRSGNQQAISLLMNYVEWDNNLEKDLLLTSINYAKEFSRSWQTNEDNVEKLDSNHHFEILDILLKKGVDFSQSFSEGQNVFFIVRNSPDLIKYFSSFNIDKNKLDRSGKTVLDYLLEDILVDEYANIVGLNVKLDSDNLSNDLKWIIYMNQSGFNSKHKEHYLEMLLIKAMRDNKIDLIEELMTYNLDFFFKDSLNRTILDYSKKMNNPKLIDLILDKQIRNK